MNSNVMMQKLVLIAPLVARVVLYVLIGLSVLSIGVILERWWFFRRRRDNIAALSDAVRKGLARGDLAAVKKALGGSRSIEAEIVAEAVDWHADGPEAVEQIMAKAMRLRRKKFESGLLFLGTLGNNAPFIGLFGTVLGIVTAFRELGGNQMGAAMGNVMSGIAEALLATAVGILVAIPAVVFYNLFQKNGADIEEGAAAIGNVVLASMRAHPRTNGVVVAPNTSAESSKEGVAVESAGRPVGVEA